MRAMQGVRTLDKAIGRMANLASLWPLVPAGVVGVITGYLSTGVGWINQFGAFGWLMAGLCGFVLSALGFALLAYGRQRLADAQAARKWSRDVDSVNPLAVDFSHMRINLRDLAHPVSGKVVGKRFVHCQLIGYPGIVVLSGGSCNGAQFSDCDFAVVQRAPKMGNAIILEDCQILGGEFVKSVLFVTKTVFEADLKPLGAQSLTYVGP